MILLKIAIVLIFRLHCALHNVLLLVPPFTQHTLAQTICPNYFSVQNFSINFSVSIRSISMIRKLLEGQSRLGLQTCQ